MAGARGATPCRRERHRARGLEYDNDGNRVLRERVSNWSDQLMVFILRARRPEVYRENPHANHVGNIAHLVTVSLIGGAQPYAIAWTANRSTPVSFTRRSHQHHRSAPAALDSRTARRRESVTRYAPTPASASGAAPSARHSPSRTAR